MQAEKKNQKKESGTRVVVEQMEKVVIDGKVPDRRQQQKQQQPHQKGPQQEQLEFGGLKLENPVVHMMVRDPETGERKCVTKQL